MARINLSIDDNLLKLIEQDANKEGVPANIKIISILEKLYIRSPFNYIEAQQKLIEEALKIEKGKEFALIDLPSFSKISVAKIEGDIKPSTVRARLGKMFNIAIRDGKVKDIYRAKDKNGNLKFISRAAVYIRK